MHPHLKTIAAVASALLLATLAGPGLADVSSRGVPLAALTTTPVNARTCAPSVPCGVDWLSCSNANASVEYVQLFDTTATVTPGTTAPYFFVALGASQTTSLQLGVRFFSEVQLIAATTPTGGSAPGTALNCSVGVQ